MPWALGMSLVLVLVAFFSAVFGLLLAASIGIKRGDRGRYQALRDGDDRRFFTGAGRSLSGLRFGAAAPRPAPTDRSTDSDDDPAGDARTAA
ncbi:hypothetical protein HNR23_003533 [Nocardiopsis mwathae]|uniref:Uncharacterized protein n=1 Tax=Nocardiopsis mwathae TaxID=1472723 RepID=A0A7W9YJT6_9ACTN|nr:hypothetical protein [Nocardiopsis mwathae]MBB6173473.1 hypothetical protein [Nocardiopsis mwathae]